MRPQVLSHSTLATLLALLPLSTCNPLAVEIELDVDVDIKFGVAGKPATYDYVVVGGGTAGLAMASRLSEKYTVAVIEAGTFYESVNNQSTVPETLVNFLSTSTDPSTWAPTDWGFTTVNQTALGGTSYHYSRAKTLGGW
jgi:choline dehydrogenase